MIVADRKPFKEILSSIEDYKKIMLMGCGGCVTVCFSGGTKALELLSSQIKMAGKKQGKEIEIIECTPERQCEYEFIDEFKKELEGVEAVLSIACGVGVQAMSERHPETITIPAQNTKFMGYPVEHGFGRSGVPAVETVSSNGLAAYALLPGAPRDCSMDPVADQPMESVRLTRIRRLTACGN